MNFQIHALPRAPFEHYFSMPDNDLHRHNARRMIADENAGIPCRISLEDAQPGETVLLLNYVHQDADSPYRACHAIYVREKAVQAQPAISCVPAMLQTRLISLRQFDREHMIIDADVVPGDALGDELSSVFENDSVSYVHLHFAKPGCFSASVTPIK